MKAARLLTLAAIAPIFPATAATMVFGGTAQVRLGYADNPFLEQDSRGASVQIGGTIAPRLTRSTSVGQTTLSGSYDRAEYLSHYNRSDSIAAGLQHAQRLNDRLKGYAGVNYSSSRNAFLGGNLNRPDSGQPDPNLPVVPPNADQSVIDQLTAGQRSRSISGNAGLDWTPSALDGVSASANASHSTYGRATSGLAASDYTSYGGSVSYTRAFGSRTRLGLQLTVNHSDSGVYGVSTSYQPNLIVQQTLSQYWAFNGSVGGIFTRSGAPIRTNSRSLGFNGSLCGTYPRYSLCFTASRQTSPSGIGGLRTNLVLGTSLNYKIDQRSRISANAQYSDSKTPGLFAGSSQKYTQAGADYSRDLNRRISVGFGGRYQMRDSGLAGKAHGVSATVNLSARFGR